MTASAMARPALRVPRTSRITRGQLLALLAVLLGSIFVGNKGYEQLTPAPVALPQTAKVQRGTIQATVISSGTVAITRQAKLAFTASGRLKTMNVAVGDAVTAGQALAELDTTSLELKLEQAQSSLRTAQTKLQQLSIGAKGVDVAAAAASYQSAVAKYNDLLAGASTADLKSAEQSELSAEASVQNAQKALDTLKNGPSQDEIITAKASVEKSQAALQSAQGAYDKVAWRPDIGARAEAVALQQATIDYQSALASFNIKMVPPVAQDVTAAEMNLAGSQAALVSAQERLNTLQGGPKTSDVEAARASVANAQSALSSKTDGPTAEDLMLQQEQITQAQLSLRSAELDVAGAKIVAPYNGVIAAVVPNVGEQVSGTAITIVDPKALRIDATIDETDVAKIAVGQPAQVTFDAIANARFDGKVIAVAPNATVTQGVVSYLVSVQFDPGKQNLPAGMTASVTIVVDQKTNTLLVPNRAVRTQTVQGRAVRGVQVQTATGSEFRPVTVGMSNDQNTEILSGLQEGDTALLPQTTATGSRVPGMGGIAVPAGGGGLPGGGIGR